MVMIDGQRLYRGLLMGPGTPYGIVVETGIEGYELRSGSRDIPRGDGGIPGDHWGSIKTPEIEIEVSGHHAVIEPLVQALLAAFRQHRHDTAHAEADQWVMQSPGLPERMIRMRPIRRPRVRDMVSDAGAESIVTVRCQFEATDPRIYSTVEHQVLLQPFTPETGGFDLDADLDADFVGTGSGGGLTVADHETISHQDAYPLIRVQHQAAGSGQVNEVLIRNITNGDQVHIDVDTAGNPFVLSVGQTLTIDMSRFIRAFTEQPVVSIDGASREANWQHPREPFRLSPGVNQLRLDVDGTADAEHVIASVRWRTTDQ